MPFRSKKQRNYLWKYEPGLARKWAKKYGSKIKKTLKKSSYKPKRKVAEGFGPVYRGNKPTPGYEGLGKPGKLKVVPQKKKTTPKKSKIRMERLKKKRYYA